MNVEEKAQKIKLLILDVDGVMTDGRIIYDNFGESRIQGRSPKYHPIVL